MLIDLLKEKKCFKLVLGAGNEDIDSIEKLGYLYSLAGANFFDVSPKIETLCALKRGLNKAGIFKDRYICVSVGTKDDVHMLKACIDSKKCINCGKCAKFCIDGAISLENSYCTIDEKKCVGCKKCADVCMNNAIGFKSKEENLSEILPPLIKNGIDCIEFHILTDCDDEIFEKWNKINELFSGQLSISTGRKKYSDEKLISTLKKMIKDKKNIIIQADGNPMSGGMNDFKTTLQTVSCAQIIEMANLPVYILLSGGTNSKTYELANLCNVKFNGISVGSYARKIVSEYIKCEDFYQNEEILNKALKIAKNLVENSIESSK